MRSLKLCVATATFACLSAAGATAQDAGNATPQPPPNAGEAQQGQKLPEVQVIQQQQKPAAKPKKTAQKPKKQPAPQAGPIAPLEPPAAVAEEGAAPNAPVFAVPAPPSDVKLSPLPGSEI